MLEAKLTQAATLKRIVEAIREMLGECNFECSETGVSLQSLDKSHIVLVSLLLGSDGFAEYRCDRSITLGLNIASLSTVLRCSGNEDVLTITAEDKANELTLTFEDPKRDRISDFSLRLMDIDQEYLGIPETEYTASITIPSADLQRILRDLKTMSESVTIEADKEGVRFVSDGDLGDAKITLKPFTDIENSENSVIINIAEPVSLSFNLQYFNNIAKSASLSPTVTIQMSANMPAEIEYRLPNGHVKFFFAPKIDDEE